MVQYARPDGHHSDGVGNWDNGSEFSPSQANLHLLIDESSTDDSDIIKSSDEGSSSTARFTLGDVGDPESDADHKVIYRAVGTGGMGATPALTVTLLQGSAAVVVASTNSSLGNTAGWPGDSYATYTITLSSDQASGIVDYDSLSIKLTRAAGEMGDSVQVSQLYFECPDEAAAAATTSPAFLLFTGM